MSTDCKPGCRHCGRRNVNRPRGLCWPCYYTTGVKDLYPSTSKYARRGPHAGLNFRGKTPAPTAALPGTPEKLEVLAARAAAGERLFHDADPRQVSGGQSAVVLGRLAVSRNHPAIAFVWLGEYGMRHAFGRDA